MGVAGTWPAAAVVTLRESTSFEVALGFCADGQEIRATALESWVLAIVRPIAGVTKVCKFLEHARDPRGEQSLLFTHRRGRDCTVNLAPSKP